MQGFFVSCGLVRGYSVTYGSAPAVKTLLLSSCALFALLSVTGCAASASSDDDGGDLVDAQTYDAPKADGGNKDAYTNTCDTIVCTQDTDCQSACPTVSNGIECCDTATGSCYAYAQMMCPAPVPDASFD
jgi:hypothetical protein